MRYCVVGLKVGPARPESVRTVCEVERRVAQPALCLPLHAGHLPSLRKPQTAPRPPLSGRESPQGTHSTLLLGP